jgi:hypothetical protein
MHILKTGLVAVAQGNADLFQDFEDGGEMWTGDGTRERRVRVFFDRPFISPPSVQCALSLWDVDYSTNMRGDVGAADISEQGFEIVFRTWGNTRIARARASWMAIGTVLDDDMWDV